MTNQFNGEGYDDKDFRPDERAGIREMWRTLSRDYVPLDKEAAASMRAINGLAKSAVLLAKIVAVMAPLGVAAAFWVRLGGGS